MIFFFIRFHTFNVKKKVFHSFLKNLLISRQKSEISGFLVKFLNKKLTRKINKIFHCWSCWSKERREDRKREVDGWRRREWKEKRKTWEGLKRWWMKKMIKKKQNLVITQYFLLREKAWEKRIRKRAFDFIRKIWENKRNVRTKMNFK